jgi:ubiquinone/menaquinone biosynthesis C-methylase UbiE
MSTVTKLHGAGKSSFDLVDVDRVFQNLSLTPSTVFLDLGCGEGKYTLAAAHLMGPQAVVYAVDAWREGLEELERRASFQSLLNITTIHANLNEHIPLEDATVDICFVATVLHDLLRESSGETALSEMARVLKPAGQLCVIEFKKIEDGPGPPLGVRLSPEETEKIITPFGFVKDRIIDVGPYHYLLTALLPDHDDERILPAQPLSKS